MVIACMPRVHGSVPHVLLSLVRLRRPRHLVSIRASLVLLGERLRK